MDFDLPDFSARDAGIALNSYTTVLGRESVPEDRFRAYWRDVHGPLCSRVPGLDWYVQHHFARRSDAHRWEAPEGVGALPGYVLDGMVEIGWRDAERQATFQDASSILFSDEQNVFEETAAYPLPHGSVTVVDRSWDPVPNGVDAFDRSHVHLQPLPGREADLAAFVLEELAELATASAEVVKLRVHAPEPHDNSTANPPAPHVRHTVPEERTRLVVAEIAFVDSLARRRFFASDAYQETLPRQEDLVASATAFAVSGVHTFVRDGELTTAGLRGSRTAELITDLAAANQVAPDVRRLFH